MLACDLSALPFHHCVVTRHPGAAEWVQARLGQSVAVMAHLEIAQIQPATAYYGVFPLHLAEAICRAGSSCWAIRVEVPAALRGQELSAAELDRLQARLVRYVVQEADAVEAAPSVADSLLSCADGAG